ncbi:MAG: hypothetical protein LBI18_09100 [Planctomycetaceae bacterium]|nr:hypothetical protein [Planctomycetaceae bacterium]
MSKKNSFLLLTLVFVTISITIGCNNIDLQGRKPVHGTVTLNGTPLTDGQISFEPIGTQKLKTRSGGSIKKGHYLLKGAFGLVPGEYSVVISSMEEVPGSRVEGADPMTVKSEYRDVIPPKFGSASEQKITVTESGKQIFNFKM